MDGVLRCFPLPVVRAVDLVHSLAVLLRVALGHADIGRAEHKDFSLSSGGSEGLETPLLSVLAQTERKRKLDFAEQLEAIAEDGTSESNFSNVSHNVFEDEEMEFVPEAPELHRLILTEEEMYAEWPKVVTLVLSLRTQLVAFSGIKASSDAGGVAAELLLGLDNKPAILKGLIGTLRHLDSVVAELGVDMFLVLDGLPGTVYKLRLLLSQLLTKMELLLATSATWVEALSVQVEKVESTLNQGGEVFRVLSTLAARLLGKLRTTFMYSMILFANFVLQFTTSGGRWLRAKRLQ